MSLLTHPDLIFLRLNQSNVDSAAQIECYSVSLDRLIPWFYRKIRKMGLLATLSIEFSLILTNRSHQKRCYYLVLGCSAGHGE